MIMARGEATIGPDFPAMAVGPSITTLIDAKIRFLTPINLARIDAPSMRWRRNEHPRSRS
jgi:hypothetical protein